MASTLTNLLYHIVFSTKERRELIDADLQPRLYKYIGGIIRGERGHALAVGGTKDHMHILAAFPPTITVSDMLQHIKGNSSKWVHDTCPNVLFGWQNGYAAFSVSESATAAVTRYIDTQAEHHKRRTFADELRVILKKNNITYDERYIWD